MRATLISTALVAAILSIGSAAAQEQQIAGTGQFCLKGASGPVKCEYESMAQCEQARPTGSSDQCLSRPEAEGTVGGPPPSAPNEQRD